MPFISNNAIIRQDFIDYATTALWSSMDMDFDRPLDDFKTIDDFAPETIERMLKDVEGFWDVVAGSETLTTGLYCHDSDDILHNFWLTRNGHGAGFWDGDYEETLGNRLTKISKTFGEATLYVGDDGLIYQFEG